MKISVPSIQATDIRIYEYGARLDADCAQAVDDQIRQSRALYNNLVAEMRRIVADMQAFVLDAAGPEARQANARVEALNAQFAEARAANNADAMRTVAGERRIAWQELATLLSGARKEHRATLGQKFLSQIGKNAGTATYQLRCQAVAQGLGWATANAVLDSALQAFKKSFAKGQAPRFAVGADKDQDSLTLQFTAAGGVPVRDLLAGKNSECRLRLPETARRRSYGEFRFRLGAAAADLYATGTLQYHRPLPVDGASIGLMRLVRRRVGPDYQYALQCMVKHGPENTPAMPSRSPLATVHFGWSADESGRRVAAIADGADPGSARLIQLPPSIEDDLGRADEMQSTRMHDRDAIVQSLKAFDRTRVPADLAEDFAALAKLPAQHVATRRLAALGYRWRATGGIPDWLDTWMTADRKAFQAHTHVARRARMRRRTFYRDLAVRLARDYEVVALEPLQLADAAKIIDESTGERTEFAAKARRGRVVAANYELEGAIRWACAKLDAVVLDIAAATASACAICGGEVEQAADSQSLQCTHCGAVLDRKCNGAALAWQLVSPDRDAWIERYRLEQVDSTRERADKLAVRKEKLALGRRARRAAEQAAEPDAQ